MNFSCKDKVKPREIFREEYGDLINKIEIYNIWITSKRFLALH